MSPIDEELLLKTCSLCGKRFPEWGNNPAPLADLEADGPCCDDCNSTKVIPARLEMIGPSNFFANGDFGRGKTVASFDKQFGPFEEGTDG